MSSLSLLRLFSQFSGRTGGQAPRPPQKVQNKGILQAKKPRFKRYRTGYDCGYTALSLIGECPEKHYLARGKQSVTQRYFHNVLTARGYKFIDFYGRAIQDPVEIDQAEGFLDYQEMRERLAGLDDCFPIICIPEISEDIYHVFYVKDGRYYDSDNLIKNDKNMFIGYYTK